MKLSEGFTRGVPFVAMFDLLSFAALTMALMKIDVSVAYAIWSAPISIVGFLLFKESMSAIEIASIALIVVGVVGLNMSSVHGTAETPTNSARPAD